MRKSAEKNDNWKGKQTQKQIDTEARMKKQ